MPRPAVASLLSQPHHPKIESSHSLKACPHLLLKELLDRQLAFVSTVVKIHRLLLFLLGRDS